jgi:hypothetical protein
MSNEANQQTGKLNNPEIAERMKSRLSELREVAANLSELEELVPTGSQLHRGLKMVQREIQSAESNLERLCAVARTLSV